MAGELLRTTARFTVMNNNSNNINSNSLDLAEIYGITPYHEGPSVYSVPTLEQIAAFSQAQLASRSSQRSPTTSQSTATTPPPITNPPTFSSPITPQPATPSTSTQQNISNELEPIMPYDQPLPVNAESIQYLNGFLHTQLGRRVRLEFIVGTSNLESRDGILLAVGANFILINVENSNDLMACDFYNLKFVTFYY